ncbi:MAG TPA: three-Cys-motif partner protein TcmP [Anaerohalosphaeraceae bacterium]|nr:three-Cys-motif partner protein TcmP [Anaerohalosphaeraceae bacterium]
MVEDKSEQFDEIGYWSEIKLEILKQYAPAYTKIMSKQNFLKGFYYIDGFAGYGIHRSKTRSEFILGSPINALQVEPPFTWYYFIDLDSERVEHLQALSEERNNVTIFNGDCNTVLLEKIFPEIKYENYKRAVCLLDPYRLNLDWKIIACAGQSKAIEIFLNFPVMDMNRNVLWRNPEKVNSSQIEKMNLFWGNDSWRNVAYKKSQGLFDVIEEKNSNEDIAEAFRERLRKEAGFDYVADPMPMRNTKGAIVYYLFFASPNPTGHKIVQDIMTKYRDKGIV